MPLWTRKSKSLVLWRLHSCERRGMSKGTTEGMIRGLTPTVTTGLGRRCCFDSFIGKSLPEEVIYEEKGGSRKTPKSLPWPTERWQHSLRWKMRGGPYLHAGNQNLWLTILLNIQLGTEHPKGCCQRTGPRPWSNQCLQVKGGRSNQHRTLGRNGEVFRGQSEKWGILSWKKRDSKSRGLMSVPTTAELQTRKVHWIWQHEDDWRFPLDWGNWGVRGSPLRSILWSEVRHEQ